MLADNGLAARGGVLTDLQGAVLYRSDPNIAERYAVDTRRILAAEVRRRESLSGEFLGAWSVRVTECPAHLVA